MVFILMTDMPGRPVVILKADPDDATALRKQYADIVRSDAAATAVAAAGGTQLRGDLTDLDSLRAGAAQADGVINLAYSNDWNNLEQGIDEEARAVHTLAAALAGSGKRSYMPAHPDDPRPHLHRGPPQHHRRSGRRQPHSQMVLTLADQGIRSSVVRLPRSVHQRGSQYGFFSVLIAAAQKPACQRTSATAHSDGQQSTGLTPPGCSAPHSRTPRRARSCTP